MSFVHEYVKRPSKLVEVEIPDDLVDGPVEIYVLKAGTRVVIESGEGISKEDEEVLLARAREKAAANGWPEGFLDKFFGNMPDFPDVDHFLTDTEEEE